MTDIELLQAKQTLADRKHIETYLKTIGHADAVEFAHNTRKLRRYLELYERSISGRWSRAMTIVKKDLYFENIRALHDRISSYALADIEARVGFTRVELLENCAEYGL